jgi:adenosylcobinamide-GDP ribazoletransferase
MVSRASLTFQCYLSDYAKEYGLAKELCDGTKMRHLAVNGLFLLIPLFFLLSFGYEAQGIGLVVTMIVTTVVIHQMSTKRLGGITGDILGCTAESVECMCSIVMAFMVLY